MKSLSADDKVLHDPDLLNAIFQFLDLTDNLTISLVSRFWKKEVWKAPHISYRAYAVQKWLNTLAESMEETWKMDERRVLITIITEEFYGKLMEDEISAGNITRSEALETISCGHDFETNLARIEYYGAVVILGDDDGGYRFLFGDMASFKGTAWKASRDLLDRMVRSGRDDYSLYAFPHQDESDYDELCSIDPWNKYSVEQMCDSTGSDVGPLRGPFSIACLGHILKGLYKVVNTEPPDNESEFGGFCQPIPTTANIVEWVQQVGRVVNSSNGEKTVSVMIGRKGGHPEEENFSNTCTIYHHCRDSITCHKYGKIFQVHNCQEAAENLLRDHEDWRSDDKYGMYAFPFEMFDPDDLDGFLDYWPQHEQFGLLNGPWTTERVVDILKQLWGEIHNHDLEEIPAISTVQHLMSTIRSGVRSVRTASLNGFAHVISYFQAIRQPSRQFPADG